MIPWDFYECGYDSLKCFNAFMFLDALQRDDNTRKRVSFQQSIMCTNFKSYSTEHLIIRIQWTTRQLLWRAATKHKEVLDCGRNIYGINLLP